MKLIYFFCFLFSLNGFAQNAKQTSDTIYIYYDSNKAKVSKIKSRCDENMRVIDCQLFDESGKKIFIRADKSTGEKMSRKKFLEKNSKKTISFELLEQNGVGVTFFDHFKVVKSRKTFFLVSNKSKRKVIIQKANISYSDFIIM